MTGNIVHTIEFPARDEVPVYGDLYVPRSGQAPGVVVLAHGFKGFRTWGFFPYLARSLQDAGLAALAIDFSHNGRSGEQSAVSPYPRADLFFRNTIRREIDDLSVVIRSIGSGGLGDYLPTSPSIGLHGHSRGGVVAILNAIEHPTVSAICTWATPGDPDTFTKTQKEKWRQKGVYEFVLSEDGIPLSVSVAYLDDLEVNHAVYHVAKRARELRVPHLVVHGETDMVVPVESARQLHRAENGVDDKRLLILRTGHTFGVSYPYSSDIKTPAALGEAVTETVDWFKTHLEGEGAS